MSSETEWGLVDDWPVDSPSPVLIDVYRKGLLVYEERFHGAGGIQGRETSTTITEFATEDLAIQYEAEKKAQIVYPACRQCGSTRGFAPTSVSGDDEMIVVGSFQYVTRRAKDGVILCGSCDWPLDPQPERGS